MLLKKLPKPSAGQSKRFRRKLRAIVDQLSLAGFKTSLRSHIFPVFLFFLFVFLINNLFSIGKINCTFDSDPCPQDVSDKFTRYIGTNVLFLNQKQITNSLKAAHPFEKITFSFKMFNTLKVVIDGGSSPVFAEMYLVKDLPILSLDTSSGSTESAWIKPSEELSNFVPEASASSFSLWDNGLLTPASTTESKIKYIITTKPDEKIIASIYKLIKIINKYLNTQTIQILGERVFLSQPDQPDIIVSVPFDERQVSEALQSYSYLSTIKKDAKVIDLRFKNPIIR